MAEALSLPEFAESAGVSRRTVERRVRAGQLTAIRAGSGQAIPAWFLPAEDRPETVSDVNLAALREAGLAGKAEAYERRVAAVADARLALAGALHTQPGAAVPHERERIWQEASARHGTTASTLRRWDRELRERGTTALVPRTGMALRRAYRRIPPDLQRAIRQAYLDQTCRTGAQIYRTIVEPRYAGREEEMPSYRSVTRFLRRETRPMEAAAFRMGKRAFSAEFAAKVVRDLETCEINEIWVADHRKFDVMVLREGRPVRPWITLIGDIRTAGFVGWRLSVQPSAVTVSHALRSAILGVGIPQRFLRDNGREFSAKRLGGGPERLRAPRMQDLEKPKRWPAVLPEEVEGGDLWSTLGVEIITALPYSAWSKPIEAWFGAFSRIWENMILGWTGRDAKRKPEILGKYIQEGTLLEWGEFEGVIERLFGWWNGEHRCGDRTKTPAEAYAGYEARIPDVRTLDYLLQDRRQLRVRPEGLELGGRLYHSEALGPWVGTDVVVRWDPGEPGEIVVYTADGQVLSVPEMPKATWAGWGAANEAAARIRRAQRGYLATVNRGLLGACTPAELDPTGTYRTVANRKRQEAEAARAGRLALPAADAGAEEQERARTEAEKARDTGDDMAIYRKYMRGIA